MKRVLVAVSIVCVASACAVSPAQPEDTGSSDEAMSVTSYGWTLPYRGGSGGSSYHWESCGDGRVMVGIYGNMGTYENQLGIICAPLYSNGTFGPDEWHWIYGGQQGSYSFVTRCQAGSAVAGVYGFSHTYLDLIGIRCDTPPFVGNNVTYDVSGGASGGDWYFDACPNGYAAHNFMVRYGGWIDGEQTQCAWIQP